MRVGSHSGVLTFKVKDQALHAGHPRSRGMRPSSLTLLPIVPAIENSWPMASFESTSSQSTCFTALKCSAT